MVDIDKSVDFLHIVKLHRSTFQFSITVYFRHLVLRNLFFRPLPSPPHTLHLKSTKLPKSRLTLAFAFFLFFTEN